MDGDLLHICVDKLLSSFKVDNLLLLAVLFSFVLLEMFAIAMICNQIVKLALKYLYYKGDRMTGLV
jgi:hypothetical protein